MTLNTPIMDIISVFDANYAHTFTFFYTGNQAIKNRLIIKNNSSNEVVYDKIQDGLRLNHTIAPNVLSNNNVYSVQAQVFDIDNNSSNLSNVCTFYCHTTPQFYFTNVSDNSVISAANLSCSLSFLQEEGDSIKEFKYYLYDNNKSEMLVSKSFYNISDGYTFYGLDNIATYYVRAIGTTVFGFNVDTGYVMVNVKYVSIPSNVAFSAINKDGKIILTSNIIITDYEMENENYKLENGELTLIDNSITYRILDEIDDFSLVVKARHIPLDSNFVNIICINGSISLSIHKISKKYYCKLLVSTERNYVIYKEIAGKLLGISEDEVIVDTDDNCIQTITGEYDDTILIVFEVHKHNNLYSLKTYYQ